MIHNFKGYAPSIVIIKFDYIPCIVQYILIAYFIPIVCTFHSPTPVFPLPSFPLVTTSLYSVSVTVFLVLTLVCCIRSQIPCISDIIQCLSVSV